jgi:uncharacterized Zn finger protein
MTMINISCSQCGVVMEVPQEDFDKIGKDETLICTDCYEHLAAAISSLREEEGSDILH